MDANSHRDIIIYTIAYTFAGALVFTVVITCLSLIGLVTIKNPRQQQRLFAVLILELVVVCLGAFNQFLRAEAAKANARSAILQGQKTAENIQQTQSQPSKGRVYVHISEETQRSAAEQLLDKLRIKGYFPIAVNNIAYSDPQKIPPQTVVRYMFPEDAQNAQELASVVFQQFKSANPTPGKYDPDPDDHPGHLEVWFSKG